MSSYTKLDKLGEVSHTYLSGGQNCRKAVSRSVFWHYILSGELTLLINFGDFAR